MISRGSLDQYIAKVSADLAAEEAKITANIAAKAIGEGSGYWQKAHALRVRLSIANGLRAAFDEEPS